MLGESEMQQCDKVQYFPLQDRSEMQALQKYTKHEDSKPSKQNKRQARNFDRQF